MFHLRNLESIKNFKIKLAVLLLFVSCSTNEKSHGHLSDFDKVQAFYESNLPKEGKPFNNYKYVVVINERGDCMNCNNTFSKKVASSIKNESVLFILSGNGTKVDLSSFIKDEYPNVIWDQLAKFNSLQIVNKCAVLELKKNTIASITLINIDNINTFQIPF